MGHDHNRFKYRPICYIELPLHYIQAADPVPDIKGVHSLTSAGYQVSGNGKHFTSNQRQTSAYQFLAVINSIISVTFREFRLSFNEIYSIKTKTQILLFIAILRRTRTEKINLQWSCSLNNKVHRWQSGTPCLQLMLNVLMTDIIK